MNNEILCQSGFHDHELERHIMDCNIPKNECEHWASKEISRLRTQDEINMHAIKRLKELRYDDFALARALASSLEIPITASNACPGIQWEQLSAGCMNLRSQLISAQRRIKELETWLDAGFKSNENS